MRRVLVGVLLGLALMTPTAASAAPSPTVTCPPSSTVCYGAEAPTSSVPSSTLPAGSSSTEYCVDNYAPGSTVVVTNPHTGDHQTVVVDANGHACVAVPVFTGANGIVAAGSNQAGAAATSTAGVLVLAAHSSGGGGGSSGLPFTGADVLPLIGAGAGLVLLGALLLAGVRRRRRGPAAA